MSVYMTEEEQIEVIKKWWQRNGTLVTILLSILLLSISGYKYWVWHQEKITIQSSNAYESMMVAFSNQDNKAVKAYANTLITEHNNSVYAHAARLTLAKIYVTKLQYDKAKESLQYVAEHAPMQALQEVARIRLARLLTHEKSYDKALNELSLVSDTVYLPLVNELKGDIYLATGHYEQAMGSYNQAMNAVHGQGVGNIYLEMKTNELAALTQVTNQNGSSPVKTA